MREKSRLRRSQRFVVKHALWQNVAWARNPRLLLPAATGLRSCRDAQEIFALKEATTKPHRPTQDQLVPWRPHTSHLPSCHRSRTYSIANHTMSAFPTKPSPRVDTAQTPKYMDKLVTVIGEVSNITPHANTLTLRLPDDENMIVLLQKNSTTVEPNLLTEVSGRLVSRGQIEAVWIKQFSSQETAKFNKSLFNEAMQVHDAYLEHYSV